MEQVSLKGQLREVGKGHSHQVRANGMIPAIAYGHGVSGIAIQVGQKELYHVLTTGAGRNNLIQLNLDDGTSHNCIIKELQNDPLNGQILHIDFYVISMRDKLTTTVPIVLTGEEKVQKAGGIIQHQAREVQIECLPADLPDYLVIDISGLQVGEHVSVGDIVPPPGVTIITEPGEVVASVVAPRVAEEPEVEEEPGEPERVGEKAEPEL
ncbi:MAG: 50S ribosomal protein L25 [Bacillota bacterium]